jgi:outer membrane lipoprotein-sorting protein
VSGAGGEISSNKGYLGLMKHIRSLLIAPLLSLALTLPVQAAERIPLDEISAWFNSFKTAQTRFAQINDDGSRTAGRLLLKRPGKLRFEYDAPETGPGGTLVMAGGGQVAIFDPASTEPPQRFPLSQTPLKIILARKVDLGATDMVVDHALSGELTTVTAQDPQNPEYGAIQLMFSQDPVRLRQWVIFDGAGGKTTVLFEALEMGQALSNSLFYVKGEMARRGFTE